MKATHGRVMEGWSRFGPGCVDYLSLRGVLLVTASHGSLGRMGPDFAAQNTGLDQLQARNCPTTPWRTLQLKLWRGRLSAPVADCRCRMLLTPHVKWICMVLLRLQHQCIKDLFVRTSLAPATAADASVSWL